MAKLKRITPPPSRFKSPYHLYRHSFFVGLTDQRGNPILVRIDSRRSFFFHVNVGNLFSCKSTAIKNFVRSGHVEKFHGDRWVRVK